MRLHPTILAMLAAAIFGAATTAGAAWEVDERGRCVQVWTPASLARGPLAILDAPLVPARFVAGGFNELAEPINPAWSTGERIGFTAGYVPLVGVSGFAAAFSQMGFGLIDTLTGGYFELAGDDARHFTLQPTQLGVLGVDPSSGARVEMRVDHCGRAIFPYDPPRGDDPWMYSTKPSGPVE